MKALSHPCNIGCFQDTHQFLEPIEELDIQEDDLLYKLDGTKLRSKKVHEIAEMIRRRKPDQVLSLILLRNGDINTNVSTYIGETL